jgi:diguanylate cyclase (GGDEF)-like protein/PAS domain S-box-containing protein
MSIAPGKNAKTPSQLAAYADLFDRLRDCTLIVDPATQIILEANNACEDILGYEPEALVGRPILRMSEESEVEDFGKALRVSIRRYYPRFFDAKWKAADGRILQVEVLACPLELSDGSTVLQLMARDVSYKREAEAKMQALLTELQAANAKLEILSTVDEMTGLFNFRYFKNELQKEHVRSERFEQPYAIIFCDIDHFKKYNDRNGHPAGDQLLREFGDLLKQVCRATDMIARYGGEEFAVICPGIDSKGGAIAAERIRKAVATRQFAHGEHQPLGHVSCSVGVASYPEHASTSDMVLKAADEAVYAAKAGGRDRIHVFEGKKKDKPSAA